MARDGALRSRLVDVVELVELALQTLLGEHVLHPAPGGLLHRPLWSLGPALHNDQPVEVAILLGRLPEELVLEVERLVIALFHSVEFLEKTMSSATNPTRVGLRNIYEKKRKSTGAGREAVPGSGRRV
jgi:hypothetical protein